MNDKYKTTDLAVASYIKLNGFMPELIKVGSKAMFIFPAKAEKLAKMFYEGADDMFLYTAHTRNLKSEVENLLKGGV